EAVYRELMSGSFHLEQPQRIGYVGPVGSYAHWAAIKHFGSSVEYEDLRAIDGVFVEISRSHVDYGLVPIESSTGGGGSETMDSFTQFHVDVHVYAEVQLSVQRCLLANCAPHDVRRIHASPESYSQCRNWLATQYPQAMIVAAPSSADAAKAALAEGEASGAAAIGNVLAGEMYGLHVLFEQIDDRPHEITRFLVLSRQFTKPSGDDKTSIMFTTADEPGALVEVLTVFQRGGVNLTHIDKRPSGRVNWEYTFFIDAAGHRDEPHFASVVDEARRHCKELTVLGSYPRSRRVL
ncbi:MAG TPA: prephenate dehydratase domain-containing protein, partial [Pirellulaceae bacterium]